MRRTWVGLCAALVNGPACEPAASRCGDGAPEVGVFCFPDREVVRVGHGFAPEAIALVDIDGDGNLDLAAVNPVKQTLSVGWGGPDGDFTRLSSWPVGETVAGLAHGDLDGDGTLDLASALPGSNAVVVLYGNGKRDFTLRRHATGDTPRNVIALDLDGGLPELVTANRGDGSLSVLRRGVADPPTIVGPGPHGLAAGDLDGDGHVDLAVTLREADAVQVMRNVAGVLVPGALHQVGSVPGAIVVGDLDGDGELDLASADELGGTVSVVIGDGTGGAREHLRWPVMQQPTGLAIVRGGGVPAVLAVLSAETSELLRLDPRTGLTAPGGTAGVASAIAAADLDRDGREEIIYGAGAQGTVGSLVLGEGVRLTSQWRAPSVVTLAAVDVGGDGSEEIVVALADGDLAIWRGPDDAFTAEPLAIGLNAVRTITRGDLDGDGLDDLVVSGLRGNSPRTALVTLVQTEGSFSMVGGSVELPGGLDRLLIGDIGGDGVTDIVVSTAPFASGPIAGLWWLEGDGTGMLGAPALLDPRTQQDMTRIDLDGDAALDVVGLTSDRRALMLFGNIGPDKDFHEIAAPRGSVALAAGDLDADGTDDLVVCDRSGLTRVPDPVGAPSTVMSLTDEVCFEVRLQDMDSDGDLDVLLRLPDLSSTVQRLRVGVLYNNGAGVLTDMGKVVIPGVVFAWTTAIGGPTGPRIIAATREHVESFALEIGPALIETPRGALGAAKVGQFIDLDGDGRPDWRGATGTELAVAFGRDGGLGPTQHVPFAALVEADVTEVVSVVHADLEHDGTSEVITLGVVDNPSLPLRSMSVIRVDAPGDFRGEVITRIAGAASSILARDLDGDHRVDLLAVELTGNQIHLTRLPGRGDGAFEVARTQSLYLNDAYGSPILAEIVGDDRLDLVISTADGLFVARGDDQGFFARPGAWWSTKDHIYDLVFGDFDADRRTDLIFAGGTGLSLLRGDGEGAVGSPRRLIDWYGYPATAADLDGDGVAEVLVAEHTLENRRRLRTGRNPGDGKFVFSSRDLGPGGPAAPQDISVLDLDADGAPEIVLHDGDGLTIVRQRP